MTQGPVRRLRRLLVLLPSAGLGGAEAHTATLVRALAAAGVGVSVAAEPELLPGLARLFGEAAVLHPAAVGWREAEPMAANIARQSAAAAPLIAALQPDAALLPLPWPTHGLGLQQALAAAGTATLVIGHLAPPDTAAVPEALALAAGPFTWAAVSRPAAGRLAACFGLPAASVAVVPNGVPVPPPAGPDQRAAMRLARRAALGLPPEVPLVVFAGRLEEKKGADLLPALAERLAAEAGATLAALGAGPLAPRLAGHPAAGPGGPLRLPGQVSDVADWLLAADALVLPSQLEGCPLVFLEAAARRCPVVATAAALECFGEGAGALAAVVEVPTVAALAAAVCMMLTRDKAVACQIEAAFAHTAANDEDLMLRRYFALLRAGGCRGAVRPAG